MRDWLVILGVLVVLGVLADGLRRIWLSRRRANELNFGLEDVHGHEADYGSELPNGGARVLGAAGHRSEAEPVAAAPAKNAAAERKNHERERAEPFLGDDEGEDPLAGVVSAPRTVAPSVSQSARKPVTPSPRKEDVVQAAAAEVQVAPVVEPAQPEALTTGRERGWSDQGQQALELDEPVPTLMELDEPIIDEPLPEPVLKIEVDDIRTPVREPVAEPVAPKRSFAAAKHDEPVVHDEDSFAVELDEDQIISEKEELTTPKEEVLVINVVAPKDAPFTGDRLLHFFQSEGLRFGDLNIFHRHVQEDGTGQVLFSVANGVEPGTFNLRSMENSYTPVLSFFLGLPGPAEPHQAFRIMVECVHNLSREMGGSLKDEQHSVLTAQTLEHYRQRICDYERRHLAPRRKAPARA
ncbi:cell division protein ZipA [Parendozoicomonas haliclonae]|uniref:Cell division protein ZipA n=1 Tax=Parendozoicomonas haliclonae TaxID=1960125 RepID=A0A1X7AH50_9GAMM|nr:Cell division protein ZipA [Parendozoicomonas haliclonae]